MNWPERAPRAGEPDRRRTVVPQTMYVRRRIQQAILDRLGEERGGPAVELVIGEAGHGKSTLLWGVCHLRDLPQAIKALAAAFRRVGNRDGIALSLTRAVARGLPVATVCQTPLMQRRLFELSAPEAPSTEIGVTALYTWYWAQGVLQDRGPGKDIDHAGVDLSPDAGASTEIIETENSRQVGKPPTSPS